MRRVRQLPVPLLPPRYFLQEISGAHWVAINYGISTFKATRMVVAAQQVAEAERARRLECWRYPDGMFGLCALLPSDKGAKVRKAIERLAVEISTTPEDDDDAETRASQKRADALAALASGSAPTEACSCRDAPRRGRPDSPMGM